ncbi:hypothetical protein ACFV98_17970 [Streptomyces violascens]|uniref:hypothetical protein n=1 Tax=Streptomyces violascens TaxID=67381 RepID=UPI003667E549
MAFHHLNAGSLDAVLTDRVVVKSWAERENGLVVGEARTDAEFFGGLGLAVKKENSVLRQTLDDASAKADGTYDSLVKKWFG